jgi:hypothetical protein
VTHRFAQEGIDTVKVRASWSGGSAEDETSIGIEKKAIEQTACERWDIGTDFGDEELSGWVGEEQLICLKARDYPEDYPESDVEWSFGDGSTESEPHEYPYGYSRNSYYTHHTWRSPGHYQIEFMGHRLRRDLNSPSVF